MLGAVMKQQRVAHGDRAPLLHTGLSCSIEPWQQPQEQCDKAASLFADATTGVTKSPLSMDSDERVQTIEGKLENADKLEEILRLLKDK